VADGEEDRGIPHLAERLNALFTRVPQPGVNQLYSNDRAAKEISAKGVKVTGVYLSLLRSGKQNNPSARLLAAIADLFDVPIDYFFDDEQAAKIAAELDLLANLRDTQVRGILARTTGVSDRGIANLGALLEQIRLMEGLEDDGKHR
jgi:transcriptional regulator with XRE-family HTH domain